ncbi:FecR family protein [Limnobacter parvus]|uniref:FecR domain-containing protein n=1 Tax=Limnobacter parvus TaxID=2939690 RepID=A0ABT1XE36_9BURK|nr:FecR domain-containing protein [Limnobacter parvus]MCR2745552.1 FecR domain-containing protein [Limnobacter parvus]
MRPYSPNPHRETLTESEADAVDWTLKKQHGPWTETEEQVFQAWLAEKPSNQSAMAQCEAVDATLKNLRAEQLAGLRAQILIDKAILNSCSPAKTSRKSFRVAALACLPVVLTAAISVAWYQFWPVEQHQFQTAVGEIKNVKLGDGTQLTLDTNTHLEVQYTRARRTVEISRGQVRFDVQRDPGRPFTVTVPQARVQVLGTLFDVRWTPDHSTPTGPVVTVKQGHVAVEHSIKNNGLPFNDYAHRTELVAVQQLALDAKGKTISLQNLQSRSLPEWTLHRITVVNTRLDELLVELNRYSSTPWQLGHKELASLKVSASFDVRNKQAISEVLNQALPLEVIQQNQQQLLVRK